MSSRRPQEIQNEPQESQNEPQEAPRAPQGGGRTPKMSGRRGPRRPPIRPRSRQETQSRKKIKVLSLGSANPRKYRVF